MVMMVMMMMCCCSAGMLGGGDSDDDGSDMTKVVVDNYDDNHGREMMVAVVNLILHLFLHPSYTTRHYAKVLHVNSLLEPP